MKIVPEDVLVPATNKSGDPVMMFLSPDSMTVFTAVESHGKAAASTPDPAAPVTR